MTLLLTLGIRCIILVILDYVCICLFEFSQDERLKNSKSFKLNMRMRTFCVHKKGGKRFY